MQPDDNKPIQRPPRGGVRPPERSQAAAQAAAADLTRSQIDAIYSKEAAAEAVEPQEASQPVATTEPTVYQRTHADAHAIHPEQWKQYHSAWQNYYHRRHISAMQALP